MLKAQIRNILNNHSLDNEEIDESKSEVIEGLISEKTWPNIQSYLFEILSEESESYLNWHTCLEVFYGAVLDHRPVDGNRIIALAYLRLNMSEHDDENFAWSLASKIKEVGYFSDYDPLSDLEVLRIMKEYK